MGIFSSIGSALGFGDEDEAAGRAAEQQRLFNEQAQGELRRQLGVTTERLEPFFQAGREQLPALTQGTTAAGLDERLGGIFDTDIFKSLVDERGRAVQGQLSAGGLTRSGGALQEAANVPTDVGLFLENLLTDRSRGLAGAGQQTGVQLGRFGETAAGRIADLFSQSGKAVSSGILGDAEARIAQGDRLLSTFSGAGNILGNIGKGFNVGGAAGTALKVAGFFSDRRLKKNIKKIGSLDILNVYQWDWVEGTKGTMIEMCADIGFMADEVEQKFPQLVSKFCGFKVIDYPSLLNELEAS
jgi:hypothetical protein